MILLFYLLKEYVQATPNLHKLWCVTYVYKIAISTSLWTKMKDERDMAHTRDEVR